jgi:hypothetical protein
MVRHVPLTEEHRLLLWVIFDVKDGQSRERLHVQQEQLAVVPRSGASSGSLERF